jgi:UDP-N-acetylglucosamine acyltransferase
VVGPEVELGPGVVVGSHVVVTGRTTVGARTRIFPFSVLGEAPQIQGEPGQTRLYVGSDVVVREFCSVHVGSPEGSGGTRIGDRSFLLNNVHVAHDCRVGSDCIVASFSAMAGHVVVGDHAALAAMVGVHQFCRIGESAFVGAGAKLGRDVLPFSRAAGERPRFAGVNRRGLERRGFSREKIAELKHVFHVLFHSKLRLEPALDRVKRESGDSPEVQRLLEFVAASRRGITR